jgi:hypothetical protein
MSDQVPVEDDMDWDVCILALLATPRLPQPVLRDGSYGLGMTPR